MSELREFIQWEPGMVDRNGYRVAKHYADGSLGVSSHRGWIVEVLDMGDPNLDDPVTIAILWGQLERRFAAVGWSNFRRDVDVGSATILIARASRGSIKWGCVGDDKWCLSDGFRKVAELEKSHSPEL